MGWDASKNEKPAKNPSFFEKVKSSFEKVKERPTGYYFKKLDSYNAMIHIGKVNLFQLNLFKDDVKLRKVILPLVALAGFLWILQGVDSSVVQLEYFIEHFPSFLLGKITWNQLIDYYMSAYGKFVHYSAFVIYMLFFVGISKHLHEKLEVVNSENVIASICFVSLVVGVFEVFWMVGYFYFQNLTWILSFRWPQMRILLQNFLMIIVGLFFILAIDRKIYKFNFNKWTWIFLSLTVAFVFIWYFYGLIFPIQTIEVPVEGYGIWTSTKFFPQTVYTVDVNILDNVAAGEQFWIQNDLLHLVNTITKAFLTLTLYNVLRIKRR